MDELQTMLRPELYRNNLFRVLNLPVTATAREVQRREARRQMEAKLGLATEQSANGILALKPPPDEARIQIALEQLHSPTDRFLAELFWFWPKSHGADKALLALDGGDIDLATKQWTDDIAQPELRIMAQHNLAVLYHLLALDDEVELAEGTASRQQATRIQTAWQRTLSYWHDLTEDPDFWSAVSARAAALDDARLPADVIRTIKEMLPSGLLQINARLALAAAQHSDSTAAQRHIRLLGASKFDITARNGAIRNALKPWQDQISQAVESAKANWTRTPHRANAHVRSMHLACQQLLATIDVVLADDSAQGGSPGSNPYRGMRDGLHDMVAEAMLDGQTAYTRKTDDWKEGIALLDLAHKVAAGGALRARLTENVGILQENAKSANDWCAPGYWDLPDDTIAVLEAARERTRTGDFDGALNSLLSLDISVGRPLRRAAAYCLSVSGIRTFNTVITEYDTGQEATLRQNIAPVLERLLLADEIDPGDVGVKRNLKEILELAELLNCPIPGTGALKTRLGRAGRGATTTPCTLPPDGTEDICFFCGKGSPIAGGAIAIPVCGDPQTRQRLFGKSSNLMISTLTVPRCRTCHDAHRTLHPLTLRWEEDRRTAGRAVPRPRGVAAALGRGASVVGALCCLAVGFVARDSRAGLDISPLVSLITAGTHASAGAVELALPIGLGLAVGLTVTVWLLRINKRVFKEYAARLDVAHQAFLSTNPKPPLPAGIRPESDYLNFPKLEKLLEKKWSFGQDYHPKEKSPTDVTGLCAAPPPDVLPAFAPDMRPRPEVEQAIGGLPRGAAAAVLVRCAQRIALKSDRFENAIANLSYYVGLSARKIDINREFDDVDLRKYPRPVWGIARHIIAGLQILAIDLEYDRPDGWRGWIERQSVGLPFRSVFHPAVFDSEQPSTEISEVVTNLFDLWFTLHPTAPGETDAFLKNFEADCHLLHRIAVKRGLSGTDPISPRWLPKLWRR
jgi:hypothetical protein